MSYQQALSQFILHKTTTNLSVLFEEGVETSIASIYRNGFFRSCREVISSTFPTVQFLIGEDRFKEIAHAFIQENPPAKGTLTGYGDKFPQWLALQKVEENPLLSQLSSLDWAWISCLYGHDAIPLTAEYFQSLIVQNVTDTLPSISLIKNAQLLLSSKNAISLWLNLKKGATVKNVDLSSIDEAQSILIWRPYFEVFARPTQDGETCFIEEIIHNKDLSRASENTLIKYPNFNLPEHFSALLQNGLLSINRES